MRLPEDRFWEKVNKNGPIKKYMTTQCWEWIACKTVEGYGDFYYQGRSHAAHRYSFILHKGDIPDGLYILHRCNNPSCVNPEHLYAGTPKDNWKDVKKNDFNGFNKGEKNGMSKWKDYQIIEVKKLGNLHYSCAEINKITGIDKESIRLILKGKAWKHIEI